MNEKNFSRRLPIILFWIIPAVGSDVVNALSHHENLTPAGTSVTSLFLTILLMGIWVYSGWSAWRVGAEYQHLKLLSAFARRGWYAVVDGKDYLMLPTDDLQEEISKQGAKEAKQFVTVGRDR